MPSDGWRTELELDSVHILCLQQLNDTGNAVLYICAHGCLCFGFVGRVMSFMRARVTPNHCNTS
ncbi:hypothetical protein BDV26DRAFT_270120 [Aspergillus bertholletiae]|uniref:Uncharacterized protein n=1 Tax=Aspergillus bertholletiae TaxID=1226010 RepID=A0A5N7AZS5_9EURO|nr:hypothetical protein BDV26DRAFT_270120 [Aspergillus bertholletiae]